MKLIVISSNETLEKEAEIISDFFNAGLQTFHIRKPTYSTRRLSKLISQIPRVYHNRLIIHSHHSLALKFNLKGIHFTKKHKKRKIRSWFIVKWIKFRKPDLLITTSYNRLSSVLDESNFGKYDYVFLSPVFESSSGKYQAGFSDHGLKGAIERTNNKVIARGGIHPSNIEKIKSLEFYGLTINSTIWQRENPIEELRQFIEKFKELGIPLE